MSTPVALYLQDAHPIREGMDIVRYAEQRGFDAVWQAESRLVREATVPMAAFASVTERIKVGSGVVDCWSRNPARLAATFSTLDDLAPGRVILGIGAWWDPLAKKVGIDRARPLTVMREIVTAVRQQSEWGKLKDRIVTAERRLVYQQEHRAIVMALRDRDDARAKAAIVSHLQHARRNLFGD